MRRREFVAALGGVTASLTVGRPLSLRAQQLNMPTIGVLVLGNPDPQPFLKAFADGLKNVGYVEGQNIRLELRSAAGEASRLPDAAADLVRRRVDVIVGYLTPTVRAAMQATKDIPIVMAPAGAPVESGLVASLARPGGNVTGMSATSADLAGKLLELMRDTRPATRRVAVLANATDPFTQPFVSEIARAAQAIGFEIEPHFVRPAEPFDAAFQSMAAKRMDAVIMQGTLIRKDAAALALKHRLPSFAPNRLLPDSGGLMSYSANFSEVYREAAVFVDKILKGRKPAELPVQQPTKFELVVNLKTAKAIGLDVPLTLLLRADEVIE